MWILVRLATAVDRYNRKMAVGNDLCVVPYCTVKFPFICVGNDTQVVPYCIVKYPFICVGNDTQVVPYGKNSNYKNRRQ